MRNIPGTLFLLALSGVACAERTILVPAPGAPSAPGAPVAVATDAAGVRVIVDGGVPAGPAGHRDGGDSGPSRRDLDDDGA